MSSALRLLAASAVSVLAVVPITAATLGKKISGQSYFGTERYVDYIAGDRPIVLTSPYGGRLKTDPLPERADAVATLARMFHTHDENVEYADAFSERSRTARRAVPTVSPKGRDASPRRPGCEIFGLDAVTQDLGRANTQERADADTAEFLARTGHRVHLAASQRLPVIQ